MGENKCIQCGKTWYGNKAHWHNMKCKAEFYKENYMDSSLVKLIDSAEKQKVEEFKQTEEYKAFLNRIEEVGFCKALWELKD